MNLKSDKRVIGILSLIILLGLFLRVYGLGDESFWVDEAETFFAVQQESFYFVLENIYLYSTATYGHFGNTGGGAVPLYFLFAFYWTKLFGLSEFTLRLLSVIFGVLSIYLIYVIGKLIFNSKIGLISAFLLAINFLHIYFSQEARPYSLGVFLTLLSTYFLILALRKQKITYWVGYILSASLLLYTHYLAFFILLSQYFFLLIYWKTYRKSIKSATMSGFAIFILYVPWLPALWKRFSVRESVIHIADVNIPFSLAKIFVQFNSWFTPDIETRIGLRSIYHSVGDFANADFYSVTIIGWLAILSALLFTAAMAFLFLKAVFINKKFTLKNVKNEKYAFLLMWFLIPIVVSIIVTLIFPKAPVFGLAKYVIFSTPAYYILVSKGLLKSRNYVPILVLLAILSTLPLTSYYSNFDKQQWRETSGYLQQNRDLNDFIFVNKENHALPLSYYYPHMKNVVGISNLSQLQSNTEDKKSFWFVYSSEQYGDPEGLIKGYLDKNYKILKSKEYSGIKIFHYTKE